ncbi:cAMP-dependent protein kinase catalytic subunit [Coemansia javaensis]|uniref:cAMP-dependent protein kinase n=1 Tax=Coemansia javaensis TaxID=2761396 RepID=A0A9W8HG97_9FUNG|nr:cAMP-dependent protein kinase catalytic subunit [Coemansia javaensis]
MAFINKILQKTKHKIGDRDRDGGGAPTTERVVPVPSLPLGLQPAPAPDALLQKHVVPSNAPPLTPTSLAARAASFSTGAYAAGKHGVYGVHPAQPQPQTMQSLQLLQPQQQQLQPIQALQHSLSPQQLQPQPLQLQPQPLQLQSQPQPQPPLETLPERSYEDTHVRLDDFEVFRTVGTGSFGRVRLVRHKTTHKYYAMKVLKKSHVVRAKQVEHVNSERRILAECSCQFIVNMLGTCQDRVNLYMMMEYVVGGELFTYLRRYHRFPAPVAKFYAAEVLLALEYMHARNIIWRDTKPENILLDARGHVKLTDMGFAKKVVDRTWTLCGTPDYLAPEVIQAKGYGRSVDWWALGILIFEMIAGYPPFYDEDHYRLYEKILAGHIQWPAQFDPVARDLVSRLLTADLSRRLGNLQHGSADIKEHRWFAEVDWARLAAREIPAPLIPQQKVEGDTSNFDKYPETAEAYGDMVSEDPYANLFIEF